MKRKGKIIGIFILVLSLLFCGSAYAAATLFPDAIGHWAEQTIIRLADKGVIKGYPDGTVRPDEIITRGQFAAILTRNLELDTTKAEKEPPTFTDIDGHWSEKNIEALVDKGILDPADYDGSFKPNEAITRIEIIRMMVRAIDKGDAAKQAAGNTGFTDDAAVSGTDKGYVIIAKENDLINGYPDNTIRPGGETSRGEAFELIDNQNEKNDKPYEEKPSPSNPGSGSGGGSVSYPNAQVTFDLPATAHTDTQINITPTFQYTQSLKWSLVKTATDGSQTAVELADVVDGSLTIDGGTITFKESGDYTLTATAVNSRGSETVCSKSITVYPVIDTGFELPEYTHTDKTVTITTAAEHGNPDAVWSVAKDGEAASWDSAIDGSLSNKGGTVTFKTKGIYVLTDAVTDATGRSFTCSKTITVYPVANVAFELPGTTHTDTSINFVTTLTEMDGLAAEWSVTKTGEAVSIDDAIDGKLTNDGGTIRFKEKGVYALTAKATDKTGRIFESTATITVYPVGAAGFYLPEITHTDATVAVEAIFKDINTATAVWTLTKDGTPVTLSEYIEGTLDNNGGSIRFRDKGKYELKAAFTDGADRTYSYALPVTVHPVPSLAFNLPATAHTDTPVKIDAASTEMDGLSVEWLVDNTFGFQDWNTYISGTLTNAGGIVTFKHAGMYELVARTTDATGRVFLFETGKKIEVLPVLDIRFDLPEATYTDRTIDLRTTGNNNVLPVEWSLTKDGQAVNITDCVEGALNALGGKIRFTGAGKYVLTASMTDALGRTFSCSDSVTVYPITEIKLTLPQVAYAREAVSASVDGVNLENLTAAWTISANGGDSASYSDYAAGTLSSDGGSIAFSKKGSYVLTVTIKDSLGRTFSDSKAITIYPIPEIGLTLQQAGYSGEAVNVTVGGSDLDNLTESWTISKDGGSAAPYSEYASGTLNSDGGNITFNTSGDYTLAVTLTDTLGRSFTESKTITIYPIPKIQLIMPQAGYIGETATVSVSESDLDNLTSSWTISSDGGEARPYTDYVNGNLSNGGGSIVFNAKGSYILSVTMIDVLGRSFTENKTITIYPIPEMQISLPQLSYSGEAIPVSVTGSNLDNLNIVWSISVDGGAAVPYTQYAKGTLGNSGGEISISTDKTVSVKLTATVTDGNNRSFTFTTDTVSVKPIAKCSFSVPSSVHAGTNFNVSIQDVSGLEGKNIVWSLTKDGSVMSYTGSLSNNGGSISINTTGIYNLTASVTDNTGRIFSHSENIAITNTAPNAPNASATVTRTVKDQKFLVNFAVSATDPDGDAVTYEYSGQSADGYYAAGSHTVKVRAKDAFGAYSEWKETTFSVANSAPSTPVITRTPNGNCVAPNIPVTITAASSDPDGDAITYVWEGRPAEISAYPLGKNTVRVKAVDAAGMESPWAAIVFFVADSTNGGGMTLTGPESVILEQGLAGATITEYTFTVPPVSGHNGDDFGRVRGYNLKTGQWDQLDYQTTNNGITFSRKLTPGVYSQLEFYYYTNHNCMYNKSNITYSVTYYFE